MLRIVFTLFILVTASTVLAQETVVIAQQLEHGSLNPAANRGLSDNTVGRVLFEGLIGFDQDLNLVPELASSWDINEDATVITFTLREGVTFHDGTAFNAEEAKSYFDWARDGENPLAGRAVSQLQDIESIDVVDPNTVRFNLSQPSGAMIYNFATANTRIISSTAIETYGEDIDRNPVGTGPFMFKEWVDGQYILVEAYADYWGDGAKVDEIKFSVVPNDATRIALLQSGEAHFIEMVPPPLVAALANNSDIVINTSESVFARIFPMNTQIEPFNDIRVRKALNHAIDREQLVQVALQGYGSALTSVMPASVFGYAEQPPYEYDLEKAKQLLSDAGYPDGFSTGVLTFNSDEFKTVGQILQQMLAKVNVTLELEPTERGALVERIFKPFEETDLEASLVGASTTTGDADRAFRASFITESYPPASNNWSFYSNAAVDALVDEAARTGDQDMRAALYAEAQAIVWDEAPWIFLYSPNNISGQVASLEGVHYMAPRFLDARAADLN